MLAVVTGMIASFPRGGVAWDYGQYVLGLRRLGFDVVYLEDTGWKTYDAVTGEDDEDFSDAVGFLEESLRAIDPGADPRFHVRQMDDTTYGMSRDELSDVIASCELFLNVSGAALLREEYLPARNKVLLDTDPGWNHFRLFPQQQELRASRGQPGLDEHDHYLTYAERIGASDCPLPTFGWDWKPTRPPVVLDRWPLEGGRERWTTLTSWGTYLMDVEHEGVRYHHKDVELERIETLPQHTDVPLEVAIVGDAPRERWTGLGWRVEDGPAASRTAGAYRDYVCGSRGEFSVAKHTYVATRCGWFSCRTVCYLAAGRPAVVQDTGFAELIGPHDGLLPWSDLDGARDALDRAEADYDAHAEGARALAEERFASDLVLGELLEQVGVR